MTVAAHEPVVLLTPAEACRALRISPNTLRRETKAGRIIATHVGPSKRGVRCRVTELQAYADRQSAAG